MTLKPPTRSFPKLKLVDWPPVTPEQAAQIDKLVAPEFACGGWVTVEALSDFTRVVEGVQTKPQKADTPNKR